MKSSGYEEFVEKFKTKKTTDDCYTPPILYDAVCDFVSKEYGIGRDRFVRPFYPGGNYKEFEYPIGCAVVDNPPFSILWEIKSFYNSRSIPYFLFAPHLTIFTPNSDCCYIVTGVEVSYENGAKVSTSFVTNMERGQVFAKSCPSLYKSIKEANDEFLKSTKKAKPSYRYPMEVMTASDFAVLSKNGIDFEIKQDECFFIRCLESQKKYGKAIFGSGLLISERAAAERAAAERAAAERAAAERAAAKCVKVWELSEKEIQIIKKLK